MIFTNFWSIITIGIIISINLNCAKAQDENLGSTEGLTSGLDTISEELSDDSLKSTNEPDLSTDDLTQTNQETSTENGIELSSSGTDIGDSSTDTNNESSGTETDENSTGSDSTADISSGSDASGSDSEISTNIPNDEVSTDESSNGVEDSTTISNQEETTDTESSTVSDVSDSDSTNSETSTNENVSNDDDSSTLNQDSTLEAESSTASDVSDEVGESTNEDTTQETDTSDGANDVSEESTSGDLTTNENETSIDDEVTTIESTIMPSTEEQSSGEGSEEITIGKDDLTTASTETTTSETTDNTELRLDIDPDQESITIKEGDYLVIKCTASGPHPKLNTLFYRDQTPLEQSETNVVQVIINRASLSDAGQYLCYGFPPERTAYVAKSITVIVERRGTPDKHQMGKFDLIAQIDTNIELRCDLTSDDQPDLKWRKINDKLSDYAREYNGVLYIYYLRAEDSGEYECYLSNGQSSKVRLTVVDPNKAPEPQPQPHPQPQPQPEPEPQPQPDDETQYGIRTYLDRTEVTVSVRNAEEVTCIGMTNGYRLEIEWVDPSGQVIRNNGKFSISTTKTSEAPLTKESKIKISNLNRGNEGTYICRVLVGRQSDSATLKISVEEGGQDNYYPLVIPKVCDIYQSTCRNGECISRSGLCDGKADCSDGSDEINCGGGGSAGRCEPNEKPCRNGKCVQKIWHCDGENDCGDNSDEDQCPVSAVPRPGQICQSNEFLCRNNQQCILKGFVCDNEYDCLDQSDEVGCEPPRITRGPIRNLTVIIGGTIIIECEAQGFPAPFINWRLNWGHVCEEPRCTSTNENGRGVLTITDARYTDAGAYSCEALNSKGRIFAVPDAIATVTSPSGGEYQPLTRPPTRPPTEPSVPCYCNNHSNQCTSDGRCLNCQHNTYGNNCELCLNGYSGDARGGTPYDCRRVDVQDRCNTLGTHSKNNLYPPCRCKNTVTGTYCDQCAERHYHLKDNRKGCSACFCNGLPVNCRSSDLYYGKIESNFDRSDEEWTISDKTISSRIPVQHQPGFIEFTQFDEYENQELYFIAPRKFLGNKLASYGGTLTFKIHIEGSTGEGRMRKLEVRISGSRINLVYNHIPMLHTYEEIDITVPISEEKFRRFGDNGQINREHMLMALSNIELIMIRASYMNQQYSIRLSNVKLEHADERLPGQGENLRAIAVEKCECPLGYTGLSCESCAPGYKRSSGGFYLGLCELDSESSQTPVIETNIPDDRLELRPGQSHIIRVTIRGSEERVSWTKEPEGALPNGVYQQNSDLVINDARPDISGTYVCYLYYPSGEVRKIITINVPITPTQRIPPSIYSPNQRISEVNLGDPFILECIGKGNPTPSIRIVTPFDNQPSSIQAPKQSVTGYIPQVKYELSYFSADNAGRYYCIAENAFGERVEEVFMVRLAEIQSQGRPPSIQINPKNIEAQEGSQLLIETSFSGTEPVEIKVELYGPDPRPMSNYLINQDKKIQINRITKDMEGQYVVTATNGFGSINDYFNLRVLDAQGPQATIPVVLRTDVGSILNIEPKVQHADQAYFTWTKDDGVLPYNAQVYGSILIINKVTKENSGVYTLTITDKTGTTKIQTTVIVEDRKPSSSKKITVSEDREVDMNVDDSLNIVCNLKPRNSQRSNLITTTTWFRGNRAQKQQFSNNIRPNNEILKITKVKLDDAGQYTCSVSSSDGTLQSLVVTLRVNDNNRDRPTAQVSVKDKVVNLGDNFEINCAVTGDPLPSIVWLFNNKSAEDISGVFPRGEIVYIRDVKSDLNGLLTCRAVSADGSFGEDSTKITVRDNQQDTESSSRENQAIVTPRSANPKIGETVRFVCSLENENLRDSVRITWSKQNADLPGGSDQNENGVLTIYNLKLEDSGVYDCQVQNLDGKISSASATLLVAAAQEESQDSQEPLKIEAKPKNVQLIQGRDGELKCEIQGGINPVVTWQRLQESLDGERHQVEYNILRIKNVQPTDRGYFECIAQSGPDNIVRDYVMVDVEAREEPKIEIYPTSVELDNGGSAYIQCRITGGVPKPSIEWKRSDGRPLSSKIALSQEDTLLHIQDAGNDEFGTYMCIAKNDEGESKGEITVQKRGGDQSESGNRDTQPNDSSNGVDEYASKPDAFVSNSQLEAQEGEEVRLVCETSSKYPVQYEWASSDGRSLGVQDNGVLTLSSVQQSDTGYYLCTVSNQFGSSRTQVYLQINGQSEQPRPSPLKVNVSPKSKSVAPGGYVEFSCNIQSSDRDPVLRWSRAGGAQLSQYHTIEGNLLRIQNVQNDDSGRYICTAQSSDGSISFDAAYLQVSRRDNAGDFGVYIRISELPTENYQSVATFRYGVKVTAECYTQEQDIEDISWSKVEGISRATYDKQGNSNTMTIAALVPMDLGTYVCIATRRDGTRAQNSIVFGRHADHGNQFKYEIEGPSEPVMDNSDNDNNHSSNQNGQDHRHEDQLSQGGESEPVVTISGEKQINVNQDGSVELNCQVKGNPRPTITWEKYGGNLPIQHRLENNILKLYDLKETDSGYYVCIGENTIGRTRDYVLISVVPGSGSENAHGSDHSNHENQREEALRRQQEEAERQRQNQESERDQDNNNLQSQQKPLVYLRAVTNGQLILTNQELKIVCVVSDPQAQVIFSRSDAPNSPRVRTDVIESGNSVRHEIIISPLETSDIGGYRCYARNRFGQAEDTAVLETESDGSISFKTEKSEGAVSIGSPHLNISSRGSLENGNIVELECNLQDNNGAKVEKYAWIRYPNLPANSVIEENRLIIQNFDSKQDNGIYVCRASTQDNDYQASKLLASNDYLLGKNPFFSFEKTNDEDGILVRCRPESESSYEWRLHGSNEQSSDSFKIEGDELHLFRTESTQNFVCNVKVDPEYGSISIDLEVNRELLDKAFDKENVNVDINAPQEINEGDPVELECASGEKC